MLTIGDGPREFDITLSRLVEERLKVRVRTQDFAQAQALLRDREPDLEGWWMAYDKAEPEVEEAKETPGQP